MKIGRGDEVVWVGANESVEGWRAGHFGVSIVRTNHIREQHKKGYMPSGPMAAPL